MVNNTFNPITPGYEELNEIIAELGSVSISNGCDLTVDVGLNGPSRIVLACSEYEIEIQSGVDGPGPVENRPASAPLSGQAGRTQNKG
jgi:hypothetical protein